MVRTLGFSRYLIHIGWRESKRKGLWVPWKWLGYNPGLCPMGNSSAVTGPEGGVCHPLGSQMVEFRISTTRNIIKQAVLVSLFVYWAGDQELGLKPCFVIWVHLWMWYSRKSSLKKSVALLWRNTEFRSSSHISATDQSRVLGLNLSLLIWTSGLLVFIFQRKYEAWKR